MLLEIGQPGKDVLMRQSNGVGAFKHGEQIIDHRVRSTS